MNAVWNFQPSLLIINHKTKVHSQKRTITTKQKTHNNKVNLKDKPSNKCNVFRCKGLPKLKPPWAALLTAACSSARYRTETANTCWMKEWAHLNCYRLSCNTYHNYQRTNMIMSIFQSTFQCVTLGNRANKPRLYFVWNYKLQYTHALG